MLATTLQVASQETPTTTVFANWRVLCPQEGACHMAQVIVQPSHQRMILEMKVFAGEEPTALLTFPLGILLNTGWQFDIDGRNETLLPFEICNSEGCHAGVRLTPDLIRALKRGNQMRVRFFDAASTEVAPQISLDGFTNAWNTIK